MAKPKGSKSPANEGDDAANRYAFCLGKNKLTTKERTKIERLDDEGSDEFFEYFDNKYNAPTPHGTDSYFKHNLQRIAHSLCMACYGQTRSRPCGER